MGFVSNKIDKNKLEEGDHIYSYRKAHLRSIHGIYVGDDRVIGYTRASKSKIGGCKTCGYDPSKQRGVVKTCLDCFLENHTLRRFEYNVCSVYNATKISGMCYPGPCDSPDAVVRRATETLDKNGSSGAANYSKLYEEHPVCFAIWCKTNNKEVAREFVAKPKFKKAVDACQDFVTTSELIGTVIGESSGVDAGGEDVDEADTAEEDDEGAYDGEDI